jgi:hypothetical protein
LQLRSSGIELPEGPYDVPESKIFHVGSGCAVGCEKRSHDEECDTEHRAQAIESHYLQVKLEQIKEMALTFGITDVLNQAFVLDIDLDYFGSDRSIAPRDPAVFYNLIRRSVAITIATEPRFVRLERLPGETITAETLLPQLKQHIARAQV